MATRTMVTPVVERQDSRIWSGVVLKVRGILQQIRETYQEMSHVSERIAQFEAYYASVHQADRAGAPNLDEARSDYCSALRATDWTRNA